MRIDIEAEGNLEIVGEGSDPNLCYSLQNCFKGTYYDNVPLNFYENEIAEIKKMVEHENFLLMRAYDDNTDSIVFLVFSTNIASVSGYKYGLDFIYTPEFPEIED